MRLRLALCFLVFACLTTPALAAEPVDYTRDIKPILAARCFKCHGPDKQESDLRLDAGKSILSGGNSGPAISAGESAKSLLIAAVRGDSDEVSRMPPEDDGEPLPAEQIALLERWIDAGAKFPADDAPAADEKRKSDHWSFQPVVRHAPPQVKNAAWASSPIDRFILAKLEQQSIAPAPEADRATLIRRVSLDLTGLLPTVAEVDAFVSDTRPDAYERLVDRLMASPAYGERFARLWLDQARYADSNGYTNDGPRVMWKYRDWVIKALNSDMPFDQFTTEQLAGDLLPRASHDQIIATGFHRNTQINDEGGSDAEQYRVEAVVDRVATTGVVFMGLTYGCARCHDHKFDPISQRNFYEMFAFLNNQDEPELVIPLVDSQQSDLPAAQQALSALEKELKELDPKAENAEATKKKLTRKVADAKKRVNEVKAREQVTALILRERRQPRESYIHIRGEFLRKGKTVSPAVPEFLNPLPVTTTTSATDSAAASSPNRLDLARWLTSPDHPLTARVTVNRHWQTFFGKGLVLTDNDFGEQGEEPSHPELLDYLASEFLAQGWSVKAMHRQIVLSATYRQSSQARSELNTVDPQNRLLARQNRLRLEAELIRDASLAAAGLLTSKLHGPSVFPPQPAGVMERTRNPGRKWNTSTGEDRYRRGLYTHYWRSTPHPFLKSFDAPEANTACTRRDRSNTPVQALTMLNDEAFVEAAQALALRLLRETPGAKPEARVDQLVRWCLGRRPTAEEQAAVLELYQAEAAITDDAANQLAFVTAKQLPEGTTLTMASAWATVARTLLNLDEFITRE